MEFTIYVDKDYIYSINDLIEYNKINKINAIDISVDTLLDNINYKSYRPKQQPAYSVMDIINNPKKYKYDYNKILRADLRYPILIRRDKNYIIDGLHRLGKAYLQNKKYILSIIVPKNILNKHIITKRNYEGWKLIKRLKINYNKN